MRRPPGPLTPWRYTAPGPSPDCSSMSSTPERHFGALVPSARNANTTSGGFATTTVCLALSISFSSVARTVVYSLAAPGAGEQDGQSPVQLGRVLRSAPEGGDG